MVVYQLDSLLECLQINQWFNPLSKKKKKKEKKRNIEFVWILKIRMEWTLHRTICFHFLSTYSSIPTTTIHCVHGFINWKLSNSSFYNEFIYIYIYIYMGIWNIFILPLIFFLFFPLYLDPSALCDDKRFFFFSY